jgi:hypothetical protein
LTGTINAEATGHGELSESGGMSGSVNAALRGGDGAGRRRVAGCRWPVQVWMVNGSRRCSARPGVSSAVCTHAPGVASAGQDFIQITRGIPASARARPRVIGCRKLARRENIRSRHHLWGELSGRADRRTLYTLCSLSSNHREVCLCTYFCSSSMDRLLPVRRQTS